MEYFYLFKKLWLYAEKERWKIVVFIMFHALSMMGELGKPYAFAMVINTLQKNEPTMIANVLRWLLAYFLCFCVFEIFHRSARFIERYVAFRNRKRFIIKMYDQLQALSLEWHSDNHSGDVIDRINRAADALYNFSESQMIYISVLMNFLVPLVVLFNLSPTIAIVSVCTGIILIVITKALYNRSVPEYRACNEGFHRVASALFDYISNITTIITLRLGNSVKKDINNRIDDIFPHLIKENRLTHIKCFSNSFLTVLLNIGLIFYYIYITNKSGSPIMIGSITAIFSYMGILMSAFDFYAGGFESVIHWNADFGSVRKILDEKPDGGELEIANKPNWKSLSVSLDNFTYKEGKFRLKRASIYLEKGRKIAFVGESGSGKSTTLKLLRGLYDITDSSVVMDGTLTLPISSLAYITTLIPQEPEIFENTIQYNITMGIEANKESIDLALRLAKFKDVVDRLPNGLDSNICEKGVNLSGGEKQRLALARGIFAIKDSSIILLDEPTGSVDPANEMAIYQGLFEHLDEQCIVSVLHRLHMVRLFDYVYVFKQGEIVEEGAFEELCRAQGEFRRLWNMYLSENDNSNMEQNIC